MHFKAMIVKQPNSRRSFLKTSALVTAGVGLAGTQAFSSGSAAPKNPLPPWRGFNLLDFFSPDPAQGRKNKPEYFKWMADWGFDFVRVPISYPSYLSSTDPARYKKMRCWILTSKGWRKLTGL